MEKEKYEVVMTSVSKRVPKELRGQFNETKDFWDSIYQLFAEIIGQVQPEKIKQIKQEYSLQWEFINMLEKIK